MLKLGFLTPSLFLGGAERWVISLASGLQAMQPAGCVLTEHLNYDDTILEAARQVMPSVLLPENDADTHQAIRSLAAKSNVLLSWGISDLADLTRGIKVPVIEVSHSDGAWPDQRAMLARSSRGAWGHVGVSHTAATAFPPDMPRDPSVIYNGADANRAAPRWGREFLRDRLEIEAQRKVVLFLGRFSRVKRIDRLISAMTYLEDWDCMLVGEGPEERNLRDMADSLAPGRVHFVPAVDHPGDCYAAADVFCLPSDYEGFPLVLAESWLAGLSTVTADFSFAREINQETGVEFCHIADRNNVQQLAAAISGAPTPAKSSTTAAAWREFTLPRFVARWERYLTGVVSETSRGALDR